MKRKNSPLIAEILNNSSSKNWDEAVKEWDHIDVYEADEPETCLCGHYPITEVCVIKNRITQDVENVGNCCVKKFLGLRPDMILNSIKKIKKDISLSVNVQVLDFALSKKVISKKDYDFYSDIWRKRSLCPKQEKWKIDINNRILRGINLMKK